MYIHLIQTLIVFVKTITKFAPKTSMVRIYIGKEAAGISIH
jgi:hypothetical protein